MKWPALIVVDFAVIASVSWPVNASGRLKRPRSVSIALRSSVTWVPLIVASAGRGSSAKLSENVAVRDLSPSIVNVHVPVPTQPLLHPLKTDPLPGVGVAVSMNEESLIPAKTHDDAQFTPAGVLVT